MRATATIFSLGLITGGIAVFYLVDRPAPAQPVQTESIQTEPVQTAQTEQPVGPSADVPQPTEMRAAPPPDSSELESVQAALDDALAEIAKLKSQIETMTVETETKQRDYDLLDREVSRLRERLAEESQSRIVLERKLAVAEENGDLVRPAAEAADPRYHKETGSEPADDTAPEPVAVDESDQSQTAAPEVKETSAAQEAPAPAGKQFKGTGEFELHAGDAWIGDGGADVFKVLSVAPADETRLDHAEVDAFGERGVVEQGAQVSRMTESGLYTLIVMRVNGKAGVLELLVQREG